MVSAVGTLAEMAAPPVGTPVSLSAQTKCKNGSLILFVGGSTEGGSRALGKVGWGGGGVRRERAYHSPGGGGALGY